MAQPLTSEQIEEVLGMYYMADEKYDSLGYAVTRYSAHIPDLNYDYHYIVKNFETKFHKPNFLSVYAARNAVLDNILLSIELYGKFLLQASRIFDVYDQNASQVLTHKELKQYGHNIYKIIEGVDGECSQYCKIFIENMEKWLEIMSKEEINDISKVVDVLNASELNDHKFLEDNDNDTKNNFVIKQGSCESNNLEANNLNLLLGDLSEIRQMFNITNNNQTVGIMARYNQISSLALQQVTTKNFSELMYVLDIMRNSSEEVAKELYDLLEKILGNQGLKRQQN